MPARARKPNRRIRPFPVVALGASAGGTEAVVEILRHLPQKSGLAYVVVQHLDPTHQSLLSTVLDKATSMPVREAKDGEAVKVDHVYVIPPNTVLTIAGRTLRLVPRSAEVRPQRPIDAFFASLAEDAKQASIAVILSGTGSDGVAGMEAVKAEGGITIAQDEATARFPEMPRSAVQADCVDLVLPPQAIARELIRIGSHPYVARAQEPGDEGDSKALTRLFGILRKHSHVDFSLYKRPTLRRRIGRRMALLRIESLAEYVGHVEENPREADALYQDMLIKVTGFFRDPAVFAYLKARILPALVKDRPKDAPVRIWVPGCASGEEAYSIAICALEYFGGLAKPVACQVFATDVSESAVERARSGVYSENIAADVPPERLRRYFTKVQGGYQVAKAVRDLCIIARQDLLKDPPFSKLDLISCRNVLIYLDAAVHKRLFPVFHYSLRPGGYLLLGSSETVGSFTSLFGLVDRRHKVFQRRPASAPVHFEIPPASLEPATRAARRPSLPASTREADVQREVERLLLARYTPPGVVVNGDLEIVQFREETDRYLHPSPGKASLNLLKMVREGLLAEVRATLQKARREGTTIRSAAVPMIREGKMWALRVEAIPLAGIGRDRQFLVLFEESPPPIPLKVAKGEKGVNTRVKALEALGERMKQELAATKEHLQSIIEEQETTNEELKSANEEILSSNEELQSTNEELETAKEELQSTNEELTTLNEELQARNLDLTQVNNDISNLLASVNLPIVMLGNDLRIRRFTPQAEKVLHLIPADVGRPITDVRPPFDLPDLERWLVEAIESMTTVIREVKDRQGRWYSLRIRPYTTREKKIEGAVLMLIDIDAHKKSADEIAAGRGYADAVFETVGNPLLILGPGLEVRRANGAFCHLFKASPEDLVGHPLWGLDGGAWEVGDLRPRLEGVAAGGIPVQDWEISLRHPRLDGPRRFRVNAQRAVREGDSVVLLALEPVGGRDGTSG